MLRWILIFGLLSGLGLTSFLAATGDIDEGAKNPTVQEDGSGFPTPRPR